MKPFGQYVGSVPLTDELRRIAALPRDEWESWVTNDLVEHYTRRFAQPTMTWEGLHPHQAAGCWYLEHLGCLVGDIPVGDGKTPLLYLAPHFFPGVKRVLVLVPNALRGKKGKPGKTERDFAALEKQFVKPPVEFHLLHYELLSSKSGKDLIKSYAPDLILADEADMLKNPSSARAQRVMEYLCDRPDVPFIPLSGSFFGRSVLDIHHILLASLGADQTPLPADVTEADKWARAASEDSTIRYSPGALTELEPGRWPKRPTVSDVRKILERRIHDTPGVLRKASSSYGGSIFLKVEQPRLSPQLQAVINDAIKTKTYPDGHPATPSEISVMAQCLQTGFVYTWEPRPTIAYRNTKRDWSGFAHDAIGRGVAQTEGLLKDLIRTNQFDDYGLLDAWERQRKMYRGVQVTNWIDEDFLAKLATEKRPTVFWVRHPPAGEKIEELLGVPFYHKEVRDRRGRFIEDAPRGSSAVVSVRSAERGLNLQYLWSRGKYLHPMASGIPWEQTLGRLARYGQAEGHIDAKVVVSHPLIERQLMRAFESAHKIQDLSKVPQKLLSADIV